ncbi:unnamed protein product [Knipowitschia caucasica]|uniref:Protein lifeguard 1-like n=1 Tax=Knipowitschia caucasica TaxID=637954 RepID=A0AAV2JR86_KNICA
MSESAMSESAKSESVNLQDTVVPGPSLAAPPYSAPQSSDPGAFSPGAELPTDQTGPPPPYSALAPHLCEEKGLGSCETFPEPGPNPDLCPDEAALTPSAFDDKTVRRAFVRKVFSLVFLQLLFTFTVVCVFTFSSTVKALVQSSIWPYVSSYIVFAVVVIPLSFCTSLSRRHPWNLIALVVVTVTLSYMVGTIASYHDTVTVVLTMGATLAIALAVIAFSAQTRYDFTVCYGLLLVLSVDLLMFVVFSSFYYTHMAQVAYGALGALIFSLFLMADVQLMMGDRVNPEEYVFAALSIYLDIILIFLYLLGRR